MNSPQQVAVVKEIIKIKNRILHSSDRDEIADLLQKSIEVSGPVAPNDAVDKLDRTMSKEWNIMSVQKMANALKGSDHPVPGTWYPEMAATLLRLAMIFVEGGLEDINHILAQSLLNKGLFAPTKKAIRHR